MLAMFFSNYSGAQVNILLQMRIRHEADLPRMILQAHLQILSPPDAIQY